jgi:methylmalonyl-CoA mutase cobalamin-binding subunit
VACLDGEWHGLPARLLAEVLERHGWHVEFLGTSVPAAQLATHLHRGGPDVVAVSSSLPCRLPAARQMVEACRATGTRVLAGGPAFGTDGRWARAVGADGWAPDARTAAALLAASAVGPWYPPGDPGAGVPPGSPVDDAAREEQALLRGRRDELIVTVAAALRPGPPPDELADDLGHLVDFLAASVFVDDATLLEEFVRWVGAVAIPAGLGADEVVQALDVLGAAFGDFPRTSAVLRTTRAGLPSDDGSVSTHRRAGHRPSSRSSP